MEVRGVRSLGRYQGCGDLVVWCYEGIDNIWQFWISMNGKAPKGYWGIASVELSANFQY